MGCIDLRDEMKRHDENIYHSTIKTNNFAPGGTPKCYPSIISHLLHTWTQGKGGEKSLRECASEVHL